MKRRDFLNLTIPSTGAVLLAPGLLSSQYQAEINRQFTLKPDYDTYDLVVIGAGLSGYFAAIHAAKKGRQVLIVDKRTSPGFDIAARKNLWIGEEGFKNLPREMFELLFPDGEKKEILNPNGSGITKSRFGDELMLFSGSIRKGLLRNLLVHKIDVLLMTDVAGIFSENQSVSGVLLASKHGMHRVKCRCVVDATDNTFFSRNLLNKKTTIVNASFVSELANTKISQRKIVAVPTSLRPDVNAIYLRPGKHLEGQAFMDVNFQVASQRLEEIEQQARKVSATIGRSFSTLDKGLSEAKISQFALECSLFTAMDAPPVPKLKRHHLLTNAHVPLTCKSLMEVQERSQQLIDSLAYTPAKSFDKLTIKGSEIPKSKISFETVNEIDFKLPIDNCKFDGTKWIEDKEQCQVLVAGGGTAGALAGQGAAEKGANTIIVDFFNDMGGTKTMSGVMGYYLGYKDNTFFKKQDVESSLTALEHNMNKRVGYQYYHQKNNLEAGNRFLSGSIICGTLKEGNKVTGILTCRNGNLEIISGKVTIDATGDADVAAFAGASFKYGNSRTGKTQNYSNWDVPNGLEKFPNKTSSRDYDIIDNTKISELQRALFLSHYQAHFYDFYPMLGIRESRRIDGLYTLDFFDAIEGTTPFDTISMTSSDFDPHYFGASEYSRCGFLLPHSNNLVMKIPYRSIVPEHINGLLISGRGISQTHNALQFTRMSADVLVLGYMTGQIAADQAWNDVEARNYDVSKLQKEWIGLGYLPKFPKNSWLSKPDARNAEVKKRVEQLASGDDSYLFKVIRWPKQEILPFLLQRWELKSTTNGKLLLAKALAWFGIDKGNELILEELKTLFEQEQKEGYPGGYVEHYDHIRENEGNILRGLFWKINQNIVLLGMAKNRNNSVLIKYILEHTNSGGAPVNRDTAYEQGRIDLRLIPF
ncbi:MAG: FAD-dependent oxidoreductase, partial [Bacteroidota bacterium]